MRIAFLKETYPGERRVALTPGSVGPLSRTGCEILVQRGAGKAAGYTDAQYLDKGASLVLT